MGAFDTLYYHEYRLRLPHLPHTGKELKLHALRDFIYALLFGTIGWVEWNGSLACAFIGLLCAEIVITLLDFLEEDRIRKLPGGERVMHALMGILYGLFLAALLPEVRRWMANPFGFRHVQYGILSPVQTLMSIGGMFSGLRDLVSSSGKTHAPALK